MERLDKVVCNQTGYSRKEVKELVRKKRIKVNDITVLKSDIKINPDIDIIKIDDIEIKVQEYV